MVVGFTFLAQRHAVKKDGLGVLQGAGVKVVVIRGEQPGPSQDISSTDDFNAGGSLLGMRTFDGYRSGTDQVKTIGGITFAENIFVGLKRCEHRTIVE